MTKIYIKELKLEKNTLNTLNTLNTKHLDKFLIKSTNEYYMYSDDNIYKIMPHKIAKLNQIDYPYRISSFDNLNIIMDRSRYITDKNPVSHIPFKHEIRKVLKREYKLNPLSEVRFVIETRNDKIKNKQIKDYYFQLNEGIEEVDHFIKENIHSFLSLLRNV
jgi:hypothetical protein